MLKAVLGRQFVNSRFAAAVVGMAMLLAGGASRVARADIGIPTVPPQPAPSSNDVAAAKHARRTACLKDAQMKKLVGAVRDQYVKNCIAAK